MTVATDVFAVIGAWFVLSLLVGVIAIAVSELYAHLATRPDDLPFHPAAPVRVIPQRSPRAASTAEGATHQGSNLDEHTAH